MSFLFRHSFYAFSLAAIAYAIWIYTIDSPKIIYHCPLDRAGLFDQWFDENCYWSTSYAEAREKFVALGNRLREQILLVNDEQPLSCGLLGLVDVQSISYDVSDFEINTTSGGRYFKSLNIKNASDFETTTPEKNTIDALLLTLRIPQKNNDKESIDIIHSSGVHGVEGYLGSAIQIRFLHEMFLRNEEQLKLESSGSCDSTDISQKPENKYSDKVRKVLLIHAVNPYGMRHHRRANENNVDLNRNALSPEAWKNVRSRDPNFVGYVDLDSAINPFRPSVTMDGEIGTDLFSWVEAARKGGFDGDVTRLQQRDEEVKQTIYQDRYLPKQFKYVSMTDEFSLRNCIHSWWIEKINLLDVIAKSLNAITLMGYTNAKRALVAAQYLKPQGMGYGGGAHEFHINTCENSIFAIQHAINDFAGFHLNNYFPNDTALSSGLETKVFWLDVHTGLGEYGNYRMLGKDSIPAKDSSEISWISKLTLLLGDSRLKHGQSSGDGVSEGYDQTQGFVNDIFLCPPPHCFSYTQEFGTRPGVGVAIAMILENKGSYVGGREFGSLSSWAFYPQRLSWRRKTLRGGIDMLDKILDF